MSILICKKEYDTNPCEGKTKANDEPQRNCMNARNGDFFNMYQRLVALFLGGD